MHPPIIEEALWRAVQEQLAQNRQGAKTRSKSKRSSLLAGLLVDENGNRLTPTHARKGARRYRYYVAAESDPPLRMPAEELEQTVVQALRAFLTDEKRLVDVLDSTTPQALQVGLARALAMVKSLGSRTTLEALVERITVGTKRLQVAVLAQALGTNESFVFEVPAELKRCGMAMRLIVGSEGSGESPRVDSTLVALIAKAQEWFVMLATGQVAGVGEIARTHQIGSSYVTRVIYLAFLAPDIVELIVSGRFPIELSAERLTRMVPLPADWVAQRELLGLA